MTPQPVVWVDLAEAPVDLDLSTRADIYLSDLESPAVARENLGAFGADRLPAGTSAVTEAALAPDGSASADAFDVSGGVTRRMTIAAFVVGLLASATPSAFAADLGLPLPTYADLSYFMPPAVALACHTRTYTGDVTAYLQTAINTGNEVYIPVGDYPVHKGGLQLATQGQIIRGAGRGGRTRLLVDRLAPTFGGISAPLFTDTANEPGAVRSDFDVIYTQPDMPGMTFADLVKYAPVFSMTDQPRGEFRRIDVVAAYTGWFIHGNSGGVKVVDCNSSAFQHADIDGPEDIVLFDNVEVIPIGLTVNQAALFATDQNVCAYKSGRCDGLNIFGGEIYACRALYCYTSPRGSTTLIVRDANADVGTTNILQFGDFQISGGDWTCQASTNGCLQWTGGGRLNISQTKFRCGGPMTDSLIVLTGNAQNFNSVCNITGAEISTILNGSTTVAQVDQPLVLVTDRGGGWVKAHITGCSFNRQQGTYATPMLSGVNGGGAISAVGNTFNAGGGSSAAYASSSAQAHDLFVGNTLNGTTIPSQASRPNSIIANNL